MNALSTIPLLDNQRFYVPQIDALRLVAALLVVLHHSPAIPGLGAVKTLGWIGVDLFLCLSAYLLTTILRLEIRRTGTLQLRAFFIRRALRIWPLYLGYALVMCVAAVFVFDQSAAVATGWMLSHLSFSANVLTAMLGFPPLPFTSHLWTISLEEQAYLLIPVSLLALSRAAITSKWLAVSAAILVALLVIGRTGFWLAGVSTENILVTPLRADGIVFGVAAALLVERHGLPGKALCLALTALVAIAALLLAGFEAMPETAGLFLSPVVGIACLAAILGVMQTDFTWKPLVYLGKISFGIYVYHAIAIRASERGLELVGIADPVVILAVTLALTFAAAAISYHLFESPFLRLKERFTVVKSRPI